MMMAAHLLVASVEDNCRQPITGDLERSGLGELREREPGLIIRDQKNNEKNIQRCIKKSDNLQIVENQILKNIKIGDLAKTRPLE